MPRWWIKTDIPLFFPNKQLPNFDKDQMECLVNEYLQGRNVRNEIIESHIRLTLTIASVYASKHPTKSDELVSDALVSLVSAVERFPRVATTNNISAYIHGTIWQELKQAVIRNRLIPIPSSTLHKKGLKHFDILEVVDTKGTSEIRDYVSEKDFVNVVFKSDEDRKILKMRVAKYTGKEIADELKVKVSYVWSRCHEIRQTLELHI